MSWPKYSGLTLCFLRGTLEPNFRPPFERISDPQIPLTRLKKME